MIVVYLFIELFFSKAYTNDFEKIPLLIKDANEAINCALLIIAIILIPIALFFTGIGIIPIAIINGLLSLVKFPKLIQNIYSYVYKTPNREPYFDLIENFVEKEREYSDFIQKMGKDYPNIVECNYNISIYFNDLFKKILEYESIYIQNIIQARNEKKQIDYWLNLDGFTFEREVSDIYRKLGYKVETTRAVADGGVDIKLWDSKNEYVIVQCKNHKNKVGPAIVRDLCGTMLKEKAERAILLCSGGFNSGVFDFAKGLPIELMDINQFLQLVDKVYPQTISTSQITTTYCINTNFTCRYNNIEGVSIPYSQYEQTMLKDGKIYFLKPIENEFCIFETEDKAKAFINKIQNQAKKPIYEECIYELATHTIQNTKFYYIRIFRKQHQYYETKKEQYKKSNKTYNKRKKYYRRWY
ncbi:MAG: restriction endonuclease [Prevotellaceae bacterium]|jgi:hypothetical protein|nr:restriction endonuclease [Prevotellaceae bacterium]